ncbi:MAG: nitronate monooxygenase [Alphaproteobacteria bacterium]|nr:nitronate monooxygenase [Alphaproteobacteria bacterium]
MISGKEVLPLIEGGKGVAVSNGDSSGAWAAAGGVGTFSGCNADDKDEHGNLVPWVYHAKTRRERQQELIAYSIRGGVTQAKIAHELSNGEGRIHMNVLWEMGGTEELLHGVLSQTKGILHGITCGAGMPFRVADICASYGVYYHPIVSSARAFKILWKRSFYRFPEWLGGVVYEDPWLAGGHNGLSNSEDPLVPQPPMPRVIELRQAMRACGMGDTPIIMAGGVWCLNEWEDWLDNPDLGPIAFQFGTRPLLTQESPIPMAWKKKLLTLKEGDIFLNRFSPTGFYSSAVNNGFIQELRQRSERQIDYRTTPADGCTEPLATGARGRLVYLKPEDMPKAEQWKAAGFTEILRTPDTTLIFVTPERAAKILSDQTHCMGCLSACLFSNWAQNEEGTTGRRADPRSFCIEKTLQAVAHNGDIENELMFGGRQAYRFGQDPFYNDGFIPTVKQLVERIQSGD